MIKSSKRLFLMIMIASSFSNLIGMDAGEESECEAGEESEYDELYCIQPHSLLDLAAIATINFLLPHPLNKIESKLTPLPYEIKEGPLAQAASRVIEKDTGDTLLHLARTAEQVEKCIALYANSHVRNLLGEIPLVKLIKNNKIDAAKMLFKNSKPGDVDIYDYIGTNAYLLMQKFDDKELTTLAHNNTQKRKGHLSSLVSQPIKQLQCFFDSNSDQQENMALLQQFLTIKTENHMQAFCLHRSEQLQKIASLPLNKLKETALHLAENSMHIETLLDLKADPHATSLLGETPLHTIIRHGNSDAALTLLEESETINVNIRNSNGRSCLDYAILLKNLDLINALYNLGAEVINKSGRKNLLKVLQTIKFAINSPQCIQIFALFAEKLKDLTSEQRAYLIIYAATKPETTSIIPKLILVGKNINFRINLRASKTRITLPMFAISLCSNEIIFDVIKTLHDLGADFSLADKYGNTVLMYAAKYKGDLVPQLLTLGCQINTQNTPGETALLHAIANNNETAFYYLIRAGADVNLADNKGITALMVASRKKPPFRYAKLLIESGANVDALDMNNKKAEDLCPSDLKLQYLNLTSKALIKRANNEKIMLLEKDKNI